MTVATPAQPHLARGDAHALYAVYQAKRDAAIRWRLDHLTNPDPDRLWRAYRTGALWLQRQPLRNALRAALVAAEHDVPFPPAGEPAP
jgi:hypothetical protein